jgi:hypothetical protein
VTKEPLAVPMSFISWKKRIKASAVGKTPRIMTDPIASIDGVFSGACRIKNGR